MSIYGRKVRENITMNIFLIALVLLIAVVAVAFALQNSAVITVAFFSWSLSGSLSLFLIVTMAAGFLFGTLMMMLSNFMRTRLASSLNRQIAALKKEKAVLEQYVAKASKTIAASVEPVCIAAEIKGPHEDLLWLEIRLKNVVDVNGETLCSGIVRDISAQRKNAEALRANEAYYQTLVEISPDAISVIRSDGTIVQANAKAKQFFGFTGNPTDKGQSIYDINFPGEQDKIKSEISNILLHGEMHDTEHKLQRQDGSFFWGSFSAKLIPSLKEEQKTILVLIRDITERKITEDNLRSLSVTDDLSGLYNRRGFSLASEQELKHALRRKEGLVLLFFDIDNLKMINDTFGHPEGDKAIKEAAQTLRATFRESDIIARWGGDEFVVLALDVPQGRTPILLQRLDQIMQEYNQKQTTTRKISFSSGTAYCDPEIPLSLAEMERMADEMMYKNKQEKKLQLRMFTNDQGEIEA